MREDARAWYSRSHKTVTAALLSLERKTNALRILTSAVHLGNPAVCAANARTSPPHSARIHAIPRYGIGRGGKIDFMAKLTLVYGMRLLPSEEIEEVGEAQVKLKNGREARVSLHIVEGSKDDIEKQLRTSIDAFFDLYPEI